MQRRHLVHFTIEWVIPFLPSTDIWQLYILEASVGIWRDDKARSPGKCPRNADKRSTLRKNLGWKFCWVILSPVGKRKIAQSLHKSVISIPCPPPQILLAACPRLAVRSLGAGFTCVFLVILAKREEIKESLSLRRQKNRDKVPKHRFRRCT